MPSVARHLLYQKQFLRSAQDRCAPQDDREWAQNDHGNDLSGRRMPPLAGSSFEGSFQGVFGQHARVPAFRRQSPDG